jgi:nucleoid-associated protein YgaU
MVAVLTPPSSYHRRPVAFEGRLGAPRSATPATYRRRRAALAAVLALVVAVLLVTVAGVSSATDTVEAGVPAASVSGGDVGATHVVQAGDTVWSIARRLQPDGDVRSLVDRIVDRNGGAILTAGQRLVLDG